MVDGSVVGILQRLGFADILLWLLSFAVVYGILAQVNIPKSKQVQAIIAIVAAFFVLMAAPVSLMSTISQLSTGLIVVLMGLIIFMVFLEVGGIKHVEYEAVTNEKGEVVGGKPTMVHFFSKNPYVIAITLILIAGLLFVGAGGLKLVGISIPYGVDTTGLLFLIMIIIAVLWMITGEKKKGGK